MGDDLGARLATVPTSTAKVILRELGVTRVVCRGLRPIVPPRAVLAGPARTVRFLPGREDVSPLARRGGQPAPDRRARARSGGGDRRRGVRRGGRAGDMLAMRARVRGAAGVVADGVVRDVVGLTAVGAAGLRQGDAPDPSGATLLPWETDIAVQCGGVLVRPGTGSWRTPISVPVVPAELAPEVASRGEATNREDEFCQRLLGAGFPLDEAYPLPGGPAGGPGPLGREVRPSLEEVRRRG